MNSVHIVTFSLLLFPLLGLFLGYLTRNHHIIRRCILFPIFAIASIAIIAGILGISTIYTNIDLILYSSLYLSISLGLWYIFFKKSRILAATLMIVIYACGYLFSLALPLTGDIMPKIIIRLDENTIYKETVLPAEYRGKQIEIFKVYNNFFEKKILAKTYYDTAPCFVNDTLSIDYEPKLQKLYLSIPTDESKYLYIFHKNFDLNWKDTLDLK